MRKKKRRSGMWKPLGKHFFGCDITKQPDKESRDWALHHMDELPDSLGPLENTDTESPGSEDLIIFNESVGKIRNFISDKEFLVKNRKIFGKYKYLYFPVLSHILEQISQDGSESMDDDWMDHNYTYDSYIDHKKPDWKSTLKHCIESYLRSQICFDRFILDHIESNSDHDHNIDDNDPYINKGGKIK